MLVATWNVNSIRARLPRLLEWLERAAPDVVCLQETKCSDAEFPFDEVSHLGYHAVHHGVGRWNGVALLSRGVALAAPQRGFAGEPEFAAAAECRAVSATVADGPLGGTRLWSVYVPNGRDPDDPHYTYKLQWLAALRTALAADAAAGDLVVCGDVNVAPDDLDVWDVTRFVGATHVTPAERAALRAVQDVGLVDVVRRRWPDERVYSYWDYRAGMFQKDMGMRIDLVLASPRIADRVGTAWVDRQARKGTGTSDHAPVIASLDAADDGGPPLRPMPTVRGSR